MANEESPMNISVPGIWDSRDFSVPEVSSPAAANPLQTLSATRINRKWAQPLAGFQGHLKAQGITGELKKRSPDLRQELILYVLTGFYTLLRFTLPNGPGLGFE